MNDEPRVPMYWTKAIVAAREAPRCGAHARTTGKPCRGAAMANGRCRMHGGKSTGPRTPEGLKKCRENRLVHGMRSKAHRDKVRRTREVRQQIKSLMAAFDSNPRAHEELGDEYLDRIIEMADAESGWRNAQ